MTATAPPQVRLDDVMAAVDAVRRGLPVLVVDDADRENEGDVIMAACHADQRWIGWTVRHSSGVLCAPMSAEVADRLDLPMMVGVNQDPLRTAFTVSVDAREGVGTGISARDRAHTLRLLAEPGTGPGDLVRPGHVFPLRARDGGVRERPGHTEAAVELCRLAGLLPVGMLVEVVDDEGEPMRLPGLRELADASGLPLISIADLIAHLDSLDAAPVLAATGPSSASGRPELEAVPDLPARPGAPVAEDVAVPPRVVRVAQTRLPTRFGTFRAVGYRDLLTGDEHVAVVAGDPEAAGQGRGTLVRVHSECLTGDALGSRRCDCGPQLAAALEAVAAEGGVVVYARGHEGRGIGLLAKLVAYELQDGGLDTVAANVAQGLPVDARDYAAAAAVLADLGVTDIRLLTNNPAKVEGLAGNGITVRERVPLHVGATADNRGYLQTKREQLGHELPAVRGL
jgi:3,4-dihydroxy 2-butanone 4-phosphate synthase / GTP cyclohydrolase II